MASGAALLGGYVVASIVMVALGELLVHVLLHGGVRSWDNDLTTWLADHRTGAANEVTKYVTYIANTEGVVVIAVVVSGLLVWRRRWREAVVLMGGLVVEVTVFLTANYIVARPRPDVAKLADTPSTSSFPSGHVAATLMMWTGIALIVFVITTNRAVRLVACIPPVLFPPLIGFARVYTGMHYPTDVIAGGLLGLMALASAIFAGRMWTAAEARRHAVESRPVEAPALKAAQAR